LFPGLYIASKQNAETRKEREANEKEKGKEKEEEAKKERVNEGISSRMNSCFLVCN